MSDPASDYAEAYRAAMNSTHPRSAPQPKDPRASFIKRDSKLITEIANEFSGQNSSAEGSRRSRMYEAPQPQTSQLTVNSKAGRFPASSRATLAFLKTEKKPDQTGCPCNPSKIIKSAPHHPLCPNAQKLERVREVERFYRHRNGHPSPEWEEQESLAYVSDGAYSSSEDEETHPEAILYKTRRILGARSS